MGTHVCYLASMTERASYLTTDDYARLYEYRQGPSLRKYSASKRKSMRLSNKSSKRRAATKDPTAIMAIRNVRYTSTSEGY